ncbi:MAG: hypothetical protein ACUZ8O_12570 [Candidatus Anammoxibacter sp.]
MDSGVSQLFWIIIIITVFVASVVKRFLANKAKANARNNAREQEGAGSVKPRPVRQQTTSEWENFLGDMFGVKPVKAQDNRPEIENRPEAKYVEAEAAEEKETITHESVELEKPGILEESGISEFHSTIEKRHLKSTTEEDAAKQSIFETDIFKPLSVSGSEYELRTKKRSYILKNMFRKEGLKNAIIYSEIIGPPVGLRKRSLFRYKNQ